MNANGLVSVAIITDAVIDESEIRRAVESPASGAVVVFSGVVRNHDGGESVRSLEYQAHPEAQNLFAQCCAEGAAETGLAIAAAHRREAFDACELLVERIKLTVPIWKRQKLADGTTEWVGL